MYLALWLRNPILDIPYDLLRDSHDVRQLVELGTSPEHFASAGDFDIASLSTFWNFWELLVSTMSDILTGGSSFLDLVNTKALTISEEPEASPRQER